MGGIFKKGTPDEIAVQEDVNTRKGVERIIRAAFDYAKQARTGPGHDVRQVQRAAFRSRPVATGLRRSCRASTTTSRPNHLYVDALTMQMVKNPRRFDVIVTCNMFGDIVTDLGAQLQGGLGVAASGNINPDGTSMFEPVHGSAPKYAGSDLSNPIAAILTAAMMLGHLGLDEGAQRIERAVETCLAAGECTRDVGGKLGTAATGDAVARRVQTLRRR